MRSLIRACSCHVQVSDDLCVADVFATSAAIAAQAVRILDKPAAELQRIIEIHESDPGLEDCEEEHEDPFAIQISWTDHPSDHSFSHHTATPSFSSLPLPSAQSFEPSLNLWTFQHALDPVQARAIACVEHRESVLLCAPTSAGKTAVAIYAVAMALHHKRRAIYTTPIKALSNQKFLELGNCFGAQYVGIMTGDAVIASDAPIVVMTLEILHSMLYKQARDPNLLDDFAFVVVDEAHFLGHAERGYAWEEVLVLLPLHVRLVLLSATVPNSRQIAEWCSRIRVEPMHVLTSEQRPVPLSHIIFRCGPADFFEQKRSCFNIMRPPQNFFRPWNVEEAVRQRALILKVQPVWRCPSGLLSRFIGHRGHNLKSLTAGLSASVRVLDDGVIQVTAFDIDVELEAKRRITTWLKNNGVPEQLARAPDSSGDPLSLQVEDLERLLSLLWCRKQLPTIGFCFDKRMCERVALLLAGAKRMDFTSGADKVKLQSGLASLEEADKLPLLREMVELLFAGGLLSVIFATETFAMGLNMPAKSVVFTDVVKFDGRARRILDSGEFRQMAGRAGRRGLDREGYVYIMLHSDRILQRPAAEMIASLYTERPPEVLSCYRLRWSSLLHLVSASPAHLDAMLSRSLQRYTSPDAAKSLQQEVFCMVQVLEELAFVDQSWATLPKGILACHLFVPEDPLLVANVLIALRGFADYSAAQAFAVCSAFVDEGSYGEPSVISDSKVKIGLETCRQVAQKLAAKLHSHNLPCCSKCGLLKQPVPSGRGRGCSGMDMIKARVNPKLCETAYQWALGQNFARAVITSGVALGGEGIVTRALRRLDELMREITFVLRHDLASPEAAQRIQTVRLSARRGVLAAPSAYLGEAEDRVGEEIEAEPPWPKEALAPGYRGNLDPLEIGFSQSHCKATFQRPPVLGGPEDIEGLARALRDGTIDPMQVNPIRLYWFRHRYYSLDNRRLAAFRLWRLLVEDAKAPVVVLNTSQALNGRWLSKFTTGFTGGRKIRITQTDLFVGLTREQSTFGSHLWSTELPEK
ncbi:SKI2 [Symbiodinium sp. KB8]|nr:SKI2 [Symbiodinium sp. KB8]